MSRYVVGSDAELRFSRIKKVSVGGVYLPASLVAYHRRLREELDLAEYEIERRMAMEADPTYRPRQPIRRLVRFVIGLWVRSWLKVKGVIKNAKSREVPVVRSPKNPTGPGVPATPRQPPGVNPESRSSVWGADPRDQGRDR